MSPFHFRLGRVQFVRKNVREQRRLELLEVQQAEDQVASEIADLESELQSLHWHVRSAIAPGHLNIDDLHHTQRYEQSLRGQLHWAQSRHETLLAEVQRRREAVVEADRNVKVLERLEEKQRV